jgi:site-specific DNA recombinase
MVPGGDEQEELVRRAFSEFATGLYNIEELRLKLYKEGLKCNRNSFWMLLRNKGYIGKVLVPAYKDELEYWVDGVHEAIIDDATFFAVQDIIEGRKKKLPNKFQTIRDEFPLRGFLTCSQCGRTLTASSSRGKMGTLFYYYHCNKGCKERYKASLVNEEFEKLIETVTVNDLNINLFSAILKKGLKDRNSAVRTDLEEIQKNIVKQKQRLKNAKEMVLDGEITSADYKEMKYETETSLERLNSDEAKLLDGLDNHGSLVDDGLEILKSIGMYYKSKDTVTKQRIVSSIYPEKLIFDKSGYRTPKTITVLSLIGMIGEGSKRNKKGKNLQIVNSSLQVESEGVEPSSKRGINMPSTCLSAFWFSTRLGKTEGHELA